MTRKTRKSTKKNSSAFEETEQELIAKVLGPNTLLIRRALAGGFYVKAKGDVRYQKEAKEAFGRSLDINAELNRSWFLKLMEIQGVPEEKAREFMESCEVQQEGYHEDWR